MTELYLLRHHMFHWLADALPSAQQCAAAIDPTTKDRLLCYEQALPGAQKALRQVVASVYECQCLPPLPRGRRSAIA